MALKYQLSINRSVALTTFAIIYLLYQSTCSVIRNGDKIDLACQYGMIGSEALPAVSVITSNINHSVYACNLYDLSIKATIEIGSLSGVHLPGKGDNDVKLIRFCNGTMYFIPNGIGWFFKNLKHFSVGDFETLTSLRTKSVTRLNFMNMDQLETVYIMADGMKKLDKDALWDLPNLEVFALSARRMKFINERVFERNQNLIVAGIISTEVHNLPAHLFKFNPLLSTVFLENNVIVSLPENLFESNGKLTELSFRSNKMQSLEANLLSSNPLLTEIDFSDNMLDYIKIDFTQFEHIEFINLDMNDCIDASYRSEGNITRETAFEYHNLTKFQNVIKARCHGVHGSGN